MDTREALLFSYLAYHNKDTLDNPIKLPTEWYSLWLTLKDRYNHPIELFNCDQYNIGDTQLIYTIDSEDRLIISFRGTKTLNDLITDIKFVKDKFIDICYTPFYLKHNHDRTDLPYIHGGFYEMFNMIKYELLHIVKDYLKRVDIEKHRILLTGHSLGGSLSILSSVFIYVNYHHLIKEERLLLENITFGSPKVGNSEFAREYNEWIINNRHYYHSCDPIPCVPILQFYTVGNVHRVDSTADSYFYSLDYHYMDNYIKYLL